LGLCVYESRYESGIDASTCTILYSLMI